MGNNIPHGYKATALGIIPQEWEVKKLGEVGKLLSGLTYIPHLISNLMEYWFSDLPTSKMECLPLMTMSMSMSLRILQSKLEIY